MSHIHDLFVGVIAILIGCLLALGAICNYTPLMSLAKPKRLAEILGKGWARGVVGLIGLVAIAMGVLIASGWRMQW